MQLLKNIDPIFFSLLSSSDDICDINFVSHDLVLIVLNKGQLLQYQKSGRIVWKTEIPILHVSRVRSQGCATSSATGFYVMTNYGTIYSLCLPYNCSSSPIIPTGSAMANQKKMNLLWKMKENIVMGMFLFSEYDNRKVASFIILP